MELNKEQWIEWLQSKGLSQKTIKNYNYYYNKLHAEQISQDYITKFINRYRRNTVVIAFLKNLFHYIQIQDFPPAFKEEVRSIEIPKQSGSKKERLLIPLTLSEVHIIAKAATKERDALMTLISFYGGLRIGELLKIKPYDFNWKEWIKDSEKQGKLKVIGKGNKQRMVYIPADIMNQLYHWIKNEISEKQEPNTPLFNVCERYWQKQIQKAGQKALNKKVNPHLLRHSLATHLLDQGLNLMELKEYLGHKDISTTQRYLHINKNKLSNKIQQVFN